MDSFKLNRNKSSKNTEKLKTVIWWTRAIAKDQNNRELYLKLHLQELTILVVCFVCFLYSMMGLFSYSVYLQHSQMSTIFEYEKFSSSKSNDLYINFHEIVTMEHFWNYIKYILLNNMYDEKTGNASIFKENIFIYRPRARQVKVKEGQCPVRKQFEGLFEDCFAHYKINYEDKSPFGPGNGTAWIYSDASITKGAYIDGKIAYYGAGGYYFDFPDQLKEASVIIDDLMMNTWLTRATKAVVINLATYNGNMKVISVIEILFEFPASGGIFPSYFCWTFNLHRYGVCKTIFSGVSRFIFVLFIIYYTVEEIFEIFYFRMKYFQKFWNIIDLFILLYAWFNTIITIKIISYEMSIVISEIIGKNESIVFFYDLGILHKRFMRTNGYLISLLCFKFIKYIDVNKQLTTVYKCVSQCFKAVLKYMLSMTIVVAALSVLGFFAFGSQVNEFSSMGKSIGTSIRIMTKDFDFRILDDVDQVFTMFFFTLFTCMVIFIFLTMMVAIVFYEYFDVHIKELTEERKLYLCDKLIIDLENIFNTLNFKKLATACRQKRLQSELNRSISYKSLYLLLRRCYFTDYGTTKILNKYGIEPNTTVHEDEARQMFEDVLNKKSEADKRNEASDNAQISDVQWLVNRVNDVEHSMDQIHKKIDIIIARLDSFRLNLPSNYAEQANQNNPDEHDDH